MSGCNTLASKHKLYEGEVANAATIRSFGTVLVEYVDNKDMGMNFVGQEKEYSVLPGEHTLIVEYADFWSPSSGDDEKVTSAPIKVTFNAEPNQTYQILHERVTSLDDSKKFAKKPVLFVKNVTSGKKVKAAFELAAPKSFVPKFTFASTPDYQFESDGAATNTQVSQQAAEKKPPVHKAAVPVSALRDMQQLWNTATKEEKSAFLQWITVK